MRRALFVAVCIHSALGCAPAARVREAPRALPSAPAVAPGESFRGVPVGEISAVVVDGRAIDRARIDERRALLERRAGRGDARALGVRAIDELVDEALVDEAAERLRVTVSAEELERAKRLKMGELGFDDARWAAALVAQGTTEAAVEREWRDQLLRARILQLVSGPIEIDETDERAAYADFLRHGPFRVEVDGLLLAGSDRNAATIVARARKGEDFCKLVASYAIDAASKASCGTSKPVTPSELRPELERVVAQMHDGDVSDALALDGKLAVLRLRRRVVPSFQDVRERMHEAARDAREDRLEATWLGDQRARARIEVRRRP